MWSTLVAILVLGGLVMAWLSGARARELAVRLARQACDRAGCQFLDDSVALQRVGVRWGPQGLVLRRMYRFEYSRDGALRDLGYILLLGHQLEAVHIQGRHTIEQDEPPQDPPSATGTGGGKVIPFPGPRRR